MNKEWEPLLESPPHPEYVSGHSCFSGAAAEVLRNFLGTDQFKFRVDSDRFHGKFRTFSSFSSCTSEIAMSRLYGGIHYRFSNEKGIEAGKKIGRIRLQKYLQILDKKVIKFLKSIMKSLLSSFPLINCVHALLVC